MKARLKRVIDNMSDKGIIPLLLGGLSLLSTFLVRIILNNPFSGEFVIVSWFLKLLLSVSAIGFAIAGFKQSVEGIKSEGNEKKFGIFGLILNTLILLSFILVVAWMCLLSISML